MSIESPPLRHDESFEGRTPKKREIEKIATMKTIFRVKIVLESSLIGAA
jgi:hypothetical protein